MSEELPPYHYFRLKGESEPDRLKRVIDYVSKWVGGGDSNGFWQKELNRLKRELAEFPDGQTVQIVGTTDRGRYELRRGDGRVWLEMYLDDPMKSMYLADIEKHGRFWVLEFADKRYEGSSPLQVAQIAWFDYAKDIPSATINDGGKVCEVWQWEPPSKYKSG